MHGLVNHKYHDTYKQANKDNFKYFKILQIYIYIHTELFVRMVNSD